MRHAAVFCDQRHRDVQVGASNELPESEELDALYDRFLIRRRVSQVRTTCFIPQAPGMVTYRQAPSARARTPTLL